jgi:hypothetical protein
MDYTQRRENAPHRHCRPMRTRGFDVAGAALRLLRLAQDDRGMELKKVTDSQRSEAFQAADKPWFVSGHRFSGAVTVTESVTPLGTARGEQLCQQSGMLREAKAFPESKHPVFASGGVATQGVRSMVCTKRRENARQRRCYPTRTRGPSTTPELRCAYSGLLRMTGVCSRQEAKTRNETVRPRSTEWSALPGCSGAPIQSPELPAQPVLQ